jgi:hypothetical protein
MKYAVVATLALSVPSFVAANPYVEQLSACLADSTTGKERKQLAEWVFLAMGAHSDIKAHLAPTASSAVEDVNKAVASLLMRLMTEDCAQEARDTYEKAGSQAFQSSFGMLGNLAMQELMGDRAVANAMTSFEKYLDAKKLSKTLTGE